MEFHGNLQVSRSFLIGNRLNTGVVARLRQVGIVLPNRQGLVLVNVGTPSSLRVK